MVQTVEFGTWRKVLRGASTLVDSMTGNSSVPVSLLGGSLL